LQSLHLQQRHSAHLHWVHLQHVQDFFSVLAAFMAFSSITAVVPLGEGWALTLLEGQRRPQHSFAKARSLTLPWRQGLGSAGGGNARRRRNRRDG
jgi:hypothetical protein